jgi:hypothetical protein
MTVVVAGSPLKPEAFAVTTAQTSFTVAVEGMVMSSVSPV